VPGIIGKTEFAHYAAGKTVTCSYIIQHVELTPTLALCYYFCNSQDNGNVSHDILRTLALQLLRCDPDLCSLIANDYVYSGLPCGVTQIRKLIPQLLAVVSNSRIIIDGVDECSPSSQRAILEDLQSVCLGSTSSCKILFSSRAEPQIKKIFLSKPQILLDGREEIDLDIRSYVKYKLGDLQTSDQSLLDKIELILVSKAGGINPKTSLSAGSLS
jgi:hypothetical protein